MKDCESRYISLFDAEELSGLLEFSDATLRTEDDCRFDVHRYALAKGNNYFKTLFSRWLKGKSDILVPGISGNILSLILIYIYTKKIVVTAENVGHLLIASDYLSMDTLFKRIIKRTKQNINVKNCLSLFIISYQVQNVDIYNMTIRFIQINCPAIIESHETLLVEMPLTFLKDILRCRSFFNTPESLIWKIIKDWVQKDPEFRKRYVSYLLCYLAGKEVSEGLAEEILNSEIVMNNPYCEFKDVLQDFLVKNPDIPSNLLKFNFNQPTYLKYRIPNKLYVLVYKKFYIDRRIYISFDEKLDLWRKLEVDTVHSSSSNYDPVIFMTFAQQHLYMVFASICMQVNLQENTSRMLFRVRRDYSHPEMTYCVKLKNVLYVLRSVEVRLNGEKRISTSLEKFDPETSTLLSCVRCCSFPSLHITVVSAFNKIYAFGHDGDKKGSKSCFQAYDPDTNSWAALKPPEQISSYEASLVEHQEKLFFLSKGKVRIFNPFIAEWKEASGIPPDSACDCLKVLNGQLYATGKYSDYERDYVWNEKTETWKEIDRLHLTRSRCEICEIDDESTIRALYKNNSIYKRKV